MSLLDYLPCGLPLLFGLRARRAGAAQALSVAEFKALAYSRDHREPCKRARPRWAFHPSTPPKVALPAQALIQFASSEGDQAPATGTCLVSAWLFTSTQSWRSRAKTEQQVRLQER